MGNRATKTGPGPPVSGTGRILRPIALPEGVSVVDLTRAAVGLFLVFHGLVHGWFVVLSQGWVAYQDEMGWNGRSWLLSRALDAQLILDAASVLYLAVAVGFVVGGVGYVSSPGWGWWAPLVAGSATLSVAVLVVTWDGEWDRLVEKGVLGILVDVVILIWLVAGP